MKTKLWGAALGALLLAGCTTAKLPAEDIDVKTVCREEIAILKSAAPPNGELKYRAAMRLNDKVDFSYLRSVETLDEIFGAEDARADDPNAYDHMITFYYQYRDRSIRYCFYRYGNVITKVEVIEK